MMKFWFLITLVLLGICAAISQAQTELKGISSFSQENEVLESTTSIISEDEKIPKHNNGLESRGKKKGGMEQMYMMFMMCKSAISSLMMLIQPIFQVKALTISFIGMLINFARFLMQLKASKSGSGGGFGGGFGGGAGIGGGSGWGAADRVGSILPPDVRPNFITRYTVNQ